jgi:SH3-like domain-containing protein
MIPAQTARRNTLAEPRRTRARRRSAFGILALVVVLGASAAQAAGDIAVGATSGLPVPRFVSLKPDRVTVRGGPTRDHEIAFVFTRSGLPVEITAESDNWRRIRDWEGAEGWVYHSLLSGRRTALVATSQACSPRSSIVAAAGVTSSAPASMAGSRRSACGASTRTRRSTDPEGAFRPGCIGRVFQGFDGDLT